MRRFEVKPNDIIMSCSGTMGKVAIIPNNINKGIINQALLKITPSENLYSFYLVYYMQGSNFLTSLHNDAKGVAIKNIASVKELKQIPIPLPSLTAQEAIVKELDKLSVQVEELVDKYEQKLQLLDDLKSSILEQVFTPKN